MPNMCIAFFVSMFVTGLFFNATVHTTLPLTSSFLMSLAVQFLCLPFLFLCVVGRGVCVYVYVYVYVYEYVYEYVYLYLYVY